MRDFRTRLPPGQRYKDIQFHLTLAEASEESISVQILRYLLDFLYLRFEQESNETLFETAK